MDRDSLKRRILEEPKPLSVDQKKAVVTSSRHVRIIAGAGAGKTETLTRRIAYLLLCEKVDPSSIVAFTFTEKAAQSMKSRLHQRITDLGRPDIKQRLGELYIGTIHGFCLNVLEDHFGYGSYDVFDQNQERAFLSRVGWSMGLNNKKNYSANCGAFLDNAGIFYNEMLDREELETRAEDFYKSLKKFEQHLDDNRKLTFNRMIYETVRELERRPEKLKHIDYLIVDEFQDINYSQYRLIEMIGANASVFVVGDPRQSIYQWRGSNEKFFNDFCDNFSGADEYQISENRRSGEFIVNASNLFSDAFSDAKYDWMESTRSEQGSVYHVALESPAKEAEWIVDQIDRLVKNGHCRYSDFGILFRSVNTSAQPFLEEMRRKRIPFLVGGKVGLFKKDEALAVGKLFCWLSPKGFWNEDPYSTKNKIVEEHLLQSAVENWKSAVDIPLPDDLVLKLEGWKEQILRNHYYGLKDAYEGLLLILGYKDLNVDNPTHAVSMANLGRFSSMLNDFDIAMRLGGGKRNWTSELNSLCWFINTYASTAYGEHLSDDLNCTDAVQLMTVHQAKGLEWPVVFLPGLIKGRFPSSKSGKAKTREIPSDMFDAARYDGNVEQEKRLFYVALTRAKDVLVMSRFTKTINNRAPSDFLNPFEDCLEINDTSLKLEYRSEEKIDEDDVQTYSPTEIISYYKCPHHYRMNKLWGYSQTIKPLIGYGNSMHHCLRRTAELIEQNMMSPEDAVSDVVDKEFHLPFAGGSVLNNARDSAKRVLKNFVAKRRDDMDRIQEVESRLEFPLQNATICGKVDVILREDKGYEIRDYKTSDAVITKEDAEFQLCLYTHGLKLLGWDIKKASIAYMNDCSLDYVSIEEKRLSVAVETAEKTINDMKAMIFSRNRSEFCKDCEYLKLC